MAARVGSVAGRGRVRIAVAGAVLVGGLLGGCAGAPVGPWGDVGAAAVAGMPGSHARVDAAPASPAPARGAARDVHVVRMVPRGFRPDPGMTPDAIRRAVDGASAYWSEQTHGEVSFRLASVSEWVPTTTGCGDISRLWAEAARHLPDVSGRRVHLLVVAPRAAGADGAGCDFGYGSLGRSDLGGSTYVTALHPELLAHELGHNLGLGHAGALECPDAQDGTWDGRAWSAGCRVIDYDDLFDVMGYSGEGFGGGYLGAVGVDRSGMDEDGVRTVSTTTTGIRLLPMSHIGEGIRILRIEVPGEPVYYAEYRTGTGRDAVAAGGRWHPSTGVRILRRDPTGGGDGSLELDATPGGRRYDRALHPGGGFTTASGAVTITVQAEDAGGADLAVQVNGG